MHGSCVMPLLAMSALAPVKSLSEPVAGEGELTLQDMLGRVEATYAAEDIASVYHTDAVIRQAALAAVRR